MSMLANFFQLTPIPADAMSGTYDIGLVILSFLVAAFVSFIALDITGRLRDVGNTALTSNLWHLGGAFAMGCGIWSMHFIGMLAFSMDDMPMTYEISWTASSLIIAIVASAFALLLLRPKRINYSHLLLGGILLGFAIASMHYCGMEAMKSSMNIHYLPGLFTLSILIAIIASEAALWLAIKSNQAVPNIRFKLKFISAIIMGTAICGMHYTGMFAAVFTPLAVETASKDMWSQQILSTAVTGVTFIILSLAIFASTLKEARNQRLLNTARQAGMAEVAASVLHNVGNILNSVNVSTTMLAEKITTSKMNELDKLHNLLQKNNKDLANFLTKDPQGIQIPRYIEMLAMQWKNEREAALAETDMLMKNINHIRNIVDMQQGLSKTMNIVEVASIHTTLDEAAMIANVEGNNHHIKVIRSYENLSPVLVDKVKLLQILVNLINNAKDSLKSCSRDDKKITLSIAMGKSGCFCICVKDNGSGIKAGNLTSIFAYGFTTKSDGHGFGLHTSALAAKEMGGVLRAESRGLNEGATFILELPYKLPSK